MIGAMEMNWLALSFAILLFVGTAPAKGEERAAPQAGSGEAAAFVDASEPAEPIILAAAPMDVPELISDDTPEHKPERQAEVESKPAWRRALPLFGDVARERGYELPLPFGVTANFMYINTDFKVDSISIGLGGAPPAEVSFLDFDEDRASAKTTTMRFDAWLLPFLNVYGVVGYTWANSALDVTIPIGPDPTPIHVDFESDGITYGGGGTLVGGYQNVFAMVDGNYTFTNFDQFDSKISKWVVSGRVGLSGRLGPVKGQVWVGTMVIDNELTLTGTLRTGIGLVDPVRFKVEQSNEHPWNALVGGQWEISQSVHLMLEGGFDHRMSVLIATGYRF
jgi:hypothetical protein